MSKRDIYYDIESIVGSDYVSDEDFVRCAYARNADGVLERWPDIVVRPGSVEEVSAIVRAANRHKNPIIPRGGGCDLTGGAKPIEEGGIVMDLTRLNKILAIDEDALAVTLETGITWGELIAELDKIGYYPGVSGPGSGMAATIGGALSNNTAGGGSTRYGLVTDNCLGVEVVLPLGDIVRTGALQSVYAKRPFCRYAMSPDLTGLFMGDVGIMGIKTKAVMRIYPRPPCMEQMTFAVPSDEAAIKILLELQKKIQTLNIHDLFYMPASIVAAYIWWEVFKPWKNIPDLIGKGVISGGAMADNEDALKANVKAIHEIVKKHGGEELGPEIEDGNYSKYIAEYQAAWLTFHPGWGMVGASQNPRFGGGGSCHKVPLDTVFECFEKSAEFAEEHGIQLFRGKFDSYIYLLPTGCVIVGGVSAGPEDDTPEKALKTWSEGIQNQVKYGGMHYWLGEVISRAIVDAEAFQGPYYDLLRNIKYTLDPNRILSPGKFYL